MEDGHTKPIYRSLDSAGHEIRLLKLHPADSLHAPVRCSLTHAYLDQEPDYEAVSYVWGSLDATQDIELDGQPFKITRNLRMVLRYLRRPSTDRVLWVDALCINQQGVEERSHQVSLMKKIYTHCRVDLAWLGPNPSEFANMGDEEMDEQTEVQRSTQRAVLMRKGLHVMGALAQKDRQTLSSMVHYWHDREGRETVHASRALVLLLRRVFRSAPLWSRLWIMQELSCAPRVTLVAGTETLDWELVEAFLGDAPYADAFHTSWQHGLGKKLVADVFGIVQTIHQQRQILRDSTAARGYRPTLMDVLARFKFALSSDPRDMIYGLLGLVPEEARGIRPDYSKSVEEVFVDVTRFIIDSTGNLDIIFQNPWQMDVNCSRRDGLSSWAADFTRAQGSVIFDNATNPVTLFAQRHIYDAGPPTCRMPCEVLDEGRLLRCRGVKIGEVGRILQPEYHEPGPHTGGSDKNRGKQIRNWMSLYFGDRLTLAQDETLIYPPTGETMFQAYWRTLVRDCKGYPIERLDDEDVATQSQKAREIVLWDGSADADNTLKTLSSKLPEGVWHRDPDGWTFATTAPGGGGLMMMLRQGARDGDVVAVLDGGKVPCILRPAGNGDSDDDDDDDRPLYRFVNVAYVHGFMDGRARREVEEGRMKEQEFLLA
ncbi:heterokaryon incompatibility protein-domain-containing protein [Xylariomycetidae sp. FL2044]|nr:heterokaryon incompatibility protein-domain-containing protein [Xylariomycetidae sp. FL2044]